MVISSFSYMLHRKKTYCIKFHSTFLLKKKKFSEAYSTISYSFLPKITFLHRSNNSP